MCLSVSLCFFESLCMCVALSMDVCLCMSVCLIEDAKDVCVTDFVSGPCVSECLWVCGRV